jgi:hypothetical protein
LTELKIENENWFITGYNIVMLPKFGMYISFLITIEILQCSWPNEANAESMDTGIGDRGVPWVTDSVSEFAVWI